MNSLILCEGSTDFVLLQYFMRRVYSWEDGRAGRFKIEKNKSRELSRGEDVLTVASVGGSGQLMTGLCNVLERNRWSSPLGKEFFHKVAIVMDRDESCSVDKFFACAENTFMKYSVNYEPLHHNEWIACHMSTETGNKIDFGFLLLAVPFEETGAMETFLLNKIGEADEYDKELVRSSNDFVDKVADPQRKYLKKRRYITKAKFDVFFSVRTSADQFVERQDILKNIPWESYETLQRDFCRLKEL